MPPSKRKGRPALTSQASEISEPFIVATDSTSIRPDATSRKFIRRHVMRGKNKKPLAYETALGSWCNSQGDIDSPLSLPASLLPQQMSGSPAANLARALGVDECTMRDTFTFMTEVQVAIYPTHSCVDRDLGHQHWMADLAHDTDYAHTMLYFSTALSAVTRRRACELDIVIQIHGALNHLQGRLGKEFPVIDDSTVLVVLGLALASLRMHDLETAKKHRDGLHTLIKLRGGMRSLEQKPFLQMKCCRFDLCLALMTDSKPLLSHDSAVSWKPYIPSTVNKSKATPLHAICTPDIRLVNVWLDLRELAISVNLAQQTKQSISPIYYQEVLISILYRVKMLEYTEGAVQEVFRLTMLVICATLFDTSSDPKRLRDPSMALIKSLHLMQRGLRQECHGLILWAALVVSISWPPLQDLQSLHTAMAVSRDALKLTVWEQARDVLRNFIWVNTLYSEPARKVFAKLPDKANDWIVTEGEIIG